MRSFFIFSLFSILLFSALNEAQNNRPAHNQHEKAPRIMWGEEASETQLSGGNFRQDLMYPYNLSDFTEITSAKPYHFQPLPFRLPFFGFSYHYINIMRDGYLAFNKGLFSYKFPVKFPVNPPDNLIQEDPSMIAPWFALQDIPTEVAKAGVYLRLVNLEVEKNITLRDRIYADFRDGMIGTYYFKPKFALIVTWRNMTMVNRRPEMPLVTNTYQCVLATDEIRTYAMFNYDQIQWITHQDNNEGLKGAPAYVGFNAGNTTRTYEFKPYSQNPRISYLTTRGFGNGLKGRYFFQIDEEVYPGSCIEKDLDPNLPDRLPLTFFPRKGNMLGGTMVNFTGPCLKPESIITCKFENWRTQAIFRDTNHASCITPPVMYHGYMDFTVTVDDRTMFLGRYYNQPPNMGNEDIVVVNDSDRMEDPDDIIIKWNPDKLAWNKTTGITLSLWGYREDESVYPHLTYIDTLAVPGSIKLALAKHVIGPTMFRDRNNTNLTNITMGFIAINLTDPTVLGKDIRHSPTLWSRPMPLAWYFRPQWQKEHGNWKEYFCDKWSSAESKSDRFETTVPKCPCTLAQAKLDRGRFAPDLECNVIDRKCDTFHRGAQHCVTSGRPSIAGSAKTCCYDDYNELIQTEDSMYGGRPSRAHPFGKHPFKLRGMIPALSEWTYDTMPFLFCCKWQPKADNAPTCQRYNSFRKSDDCTAYKGPAVGSVYGDPHFITFDRWNYTFNGKGEYTLVHVDNHDHKFDVQGRFEQVARRRRSDPLINATALTAVAARDNQSSVVEFRVRPAAAQWKYHMFVIVDKEYIFFEESLNYQYFRGVTLYQPAGIQNMSHVIAMFDSGAGVEVMMIGGQMSVHVYVADTFMNRTAGLLGKYSKDIKDDFTLLDGQVIPLISTAEEIHKKFGQTWRVEEKVSIGASNKIASLFHHDAVPFASYDDPNFVPNYEPHLPDSAKHLKEEMDAVCDDSNSCKYDYMMTLDKNIAKATKENEDYGLYLANEANKRYIRCPALPKPINGHKSENRYWPGTIVRFACDHGYVLNGTETRRCQENGQWSGVEAKCLKKP